MPSRYTASASKSAVNRQACVPDALDHAREVLLPVPGDAHLGVELDERHILRLGQAVQEPDGRRPGELDVSLHAAARVEQQPDPQVVGLVGGVAAGEVRDALALAFLVHSKSFSLRSVMKLPRLSSTITPTFTTSTPERNRPCWRSRPGE